MLTFGLDFLTGDLFLAYLFKIKSFARNPV